MVAHSFELPGVPAELPALLQAAAGAQPLALVGGAVRDLLLHRVHNDPWRGLVDLDLVVEGSAHVFVERLQEELLAREAASGEAHLVAAQEHGAYGTVELELRLAGQTVLLDVATARRETYLQLGENPAVAFGSLVDDLARRDFTINAMALLLSSISPEPGPVDSSEALLDPHSGQLDLEQRQLRLLHQGSVADDPTRLVRGARYAARLGFELAAASVEQARCTLVAWPWSWRHGDPPGLAPAALGTRLRMELELLLEREPWPQALAALQHWGGLKLLDAALQAEAAPVRDRRLRWAARLGIGRLTALLAGASDPLALAERLQLPHRQHKLLVQWLALRRRWLQLLEQPPGLPHDPVDAAPTTAAQWSLWLEAAGSSSEAVALELACGDLLPRRPLLRWWLRWRHLKAPLSAAQLIEAEGLRPGPVLGERLRQLRVQCLERERC